MVHDALDGSYTTIFVDSAQESFDGGCHHIRSRPDIGSACCNNSFSQAQLVAQPRVRGIAQDSLTNLIPGCARLGLIFEVVTKYAGTMDNQRANLLF